MAINHTRVHLSQLTLKFKRSTKNKEKVMGYGASAYGNKKKKKVKKPKGK